MVTGASAEGADCLHPAPMAAPIAARPMAIAAQLRPHRRDRIGSVACGCDSLDLDELVSSERYARIIQDPCTARAGICDIRGHNSRADRGLGLQPRGEAHVLPGRLDRVQL